MPSFMLLAGFVAVMSDYLLGASATTGHPLWAHVRAVNHPTLRCVYSEWDKALFGAACIPLLNVAGVQLNLTSDK